MVHMAEEFDFTQCPFGINSIVKSISDLLNRNLFICLWISCTAASN